MFRHPENEFQATRCAIYRVCTVLRDRVQGKLSFI